MSWTPQHLDQLGYLSRGRSRHRPRDAAHLYDGPYPFIQTGDIKHAGLYVTTYEQTYSEVGLEQSRLWPAGTLCITIAANIADTAILGIDACFPDSVIGFIPDEKKADARFVKYLFDATIQQRVQQFTQGAAQDNLSQEKLLSIEFMVPSISEQSRIADILSAYDDLIENNRRRMALLEDAARQLYREWFVRLRFPGYEHTRITNGVPEGWEKKRFGKVLNHEIGGGWGQDEPQGTETEEGYVIRGTDIPEVEAGDFGAVGLRYHDPRRLPQRILQAGDIIFEVSGGSATQAIGRTLLITEETLRALAPRVICASFCKLFRVEDLVSPYFLLRFLRHIRESGELSVFQKQSASALQNFQYQAFLEEQEVLVPTTVLLKEFCATQASFLRQQQTLAIQSHKLRAARDLLLPRLMSGDIAA